MDPARKRQLMVERHIRARGIRDPRMLAAIGSVPREAFLPPELAEFAYEDHPLPIEAGQTISQPYIVALMTELLARRLEYAARDDDELFDAAQHARAIAGAERYYRAMYHGSVVSWSLRDQHMFDTLCSILAHRGAETRPS